MFTKNPQLVMQSKIKKVYVGDLNGTLATAVILVDIRLQTPQGVNDGSNALLRLSLAKDKDGWRITQQAASGQGDDAASQLPTLPNASATQATPPRPSPRSRAARPAPQPSSTGSFKTPSANQDPPARRCLDGYMTTRQQAPRVVSASREIEAGSERIFELIADPAQQPRWDGNDNLAVAPAGQRVRRAGDVFTMTLTRGRIRENHVVEFEEGRRLAWTPAEAGKRPPGHLWRWELEPLGSSRTRVTHTYDWTRLTDKKRLPRAQATTTVNLRASLDRLAALAEEP